MKQNWIEMNMIEQNWVDWIGWIGQNGLNLI